MDINDAKQFMELRSKLFDEFHALENEIDDLDEKRENLSARYTALERILDGSVGDIADIPDLESITQVVVTQKGTDNTFTIVPDRERLVSYLRENPGSSRKQIAADLVLDDTIVKGLLGWAKKHQIAINTNRGRSSVWYLSEDQ